MVRARPRGPFGARALAGLLALAGCAHWVVPGFYEPVIPTALPGAPRAWVLASGAAELAVAAAVAQARTRRLGATLAAVLFVVVFPANVQMAVDWSGQGALKATAAWARLPLQAPLIWWALAVRRHAGQPSRTAG